ncbi:MAG: anhydro-N-acetylmuramic acid kinase [Pseudomonadota bacterium]|nr:anhydro-N-acetylmuramic acid kinase [Pseudomonadota bacterium]
MSGTSLDGIDAVLVDFGPLREARPCRVLASATRPLAASLRTELMQLQAPAPDELARAARAANALADAYAAIIQAVLTRAGVAPDDVEAAGVHGQTVRHRPEESWTLQLNNAARIAECCGVTVVADFRSRDVAAGGQGAPLVPAFHAALFSGPVHRVVVNVGGIANITDLPVDGPVRGFDTGPGNVLLDLWHLRHRGNAFDRGGAWARKGRVDPRLLRVMRAEPYFERAPPKSTGRDLFNAAWLESRLSEAAADGLTRAPVDVQATLVALTAGTVADAIRTQCSGASEVLVCGGGANNGALMDALAAELAPRHVMSTSVRGVAAEQVEAMAFAWLARESLAGRESSLPDVTGARAARVLGAVYHR